MFGLFKSQLSKDAESYVEGTIAHERLGLTLKQALPLDAEANRLAHIAKANGFTYVDLAVMLCDSSYHYNERLCLMPDGSAKMLSTTDSPGDLATRLADDAHLAKLDRLLTAVYKAAFSTGQLKATPQFGTVGHAVSHQ
jgi:hypothetical protein